MNRLSRIAALEVAGFVRQLLERRVQYHNVQLQNLQASELSTTTASSRVLSGTPITGKCLVGQRLVEHDNRSQPCWSTAVGRRRTLDLPKAAKAGLLNVRY